MKFWFTLTFQNVVFKIILMDFRIFFWKVFFWITFHFSLFSIFHSLCLSLLCIPFGILVFFFSDSPTAIAAAALNSSSSGASTLQFSELSSLLSPTNHIDSRSTTHSQYHDNRGGGSRNNNTNSSDYLQTSLYSANSTRDSRTVRVGFGLER